MRCFSLAAGVPKFRDSGKDFIRQLVELIGAKNNPAEVKNVINYLASGNDPALSFAAVRGLGKGLERAGTSLTAVDKDGKMADIMKSAGSSFVAKFECGSETTRASDSVARRNEF